MLIGVWHDVILGVDCIRISRNNTCLECSISYIVLKVEHELERYTYYMG